MRFRYLPFVVLLLLLAGGFGPFAGSTAPAANAANPLAPALTPTATPVVPPHDVALSPLGTFHSGGGESAAEIIAYDPVSQTIYIVNAVSATLDVVSIRTPSSPTKLYSLDVTPYGAVANSAAFKNGFLAVAVESSPKTDPGKVVFFNRQGQFVNAVTVGALPDMLTFTPNGQKLLVANEGEPNNTYTVDPEGSVSIIDLSGGVAGLSQANVATVGFGAFNVGAPRYGELSSDVRIFGPNASVAQDLEPEYIAISADSLTAWVTLQENNALAIIDISGTFVRSIVPLGFKDHSFIGNALDASDRDNAINIGNWPVRGLYMPDGIAAYLAGNDTYIVTANEGDSRAYESYNEEARVGALRLDGTAFPNTATLQSNAALGRLTVTRANGDTDADGDYEALYAFGARSFSIRNASGQLIYDSGDDFEQITAAIFPHDFNSEESIFDSRSDNKGPEPEGVVLGAIGGRTYAFIGLERIGGIMVYDVTNPATPHFIQYVNPYNFESASGDAGPEGLLFIPAAESPTGQPLLVVGNEYSGSTTVYGIGEPDGAGTLTLLHNNDGESSLLPIGYQVAPNAGYPNTTTVSLPVGGVAAFKTLTTQQIDQARARGHAVVNVYAGDAFLASATLACSLPPFTDTTPIYDAVAQRQMPYDAHIIGNHEFDYGPDFLERFIRSFEINGRLTQPFLSTNLDFRAEGGFADLLDADGVIVGFTTDERVVAHSAIVADEVNGQRFGIVGATTPLLPTISTPRNVSVTTTLTETAQVVQAEINRLYDAYGVRKIIFVSHLQDVRNDRDLVRMLRRVDVAVAGGGDELLASTTVPTRTQLLPGEQARIDGPYPIMQPDADNRTVPIVTTAGNYKYLGRLDVEFNAQGEVARVISESSYPRRVIPASPVATALGLTDAVAKDPALIASVEQPVQACLSEFANTPIARSQVLLNVSRAAVRGAESNAGNLIADALLYVYQQHAANVGLPPISAANPVIAVQNGGSIRQNAGDILPSGGISGTISRLDTINVLPFDNFVSVVSNVTPADLKAIFERSAASLPGQGGQFLQVAGITVTIDVRLPVGSRVRTATLRTGTPIIRNGQPVAGAPAVRVVTNSFTAAGGDDFPTFANNPNKRRLLTDSGYAISYEEAWREYLRSFPVINGLPTILATDARYRPGGEGRLAILRLFRLLPLVTKGAAPR